MTPVKLSLLLLTALMGAATARAQTPTGTEPPRHTIAAVKALPVFVARVLPEESRSLFWGTIPHQPGGKTVGLHLYALLPSELQAAGKCHFVLDIFNVPQSASAQSPGSEPKRRSKRRPPLINRVLFSTVFSAPPTSFSLAFTWLDPAHAEPVLVIKSFAGSGSGSAGIEHFVTFPHGWKNPASVCNLRFGGGEAANPARETNRLLVSKDGSPTIQATLLPATDAPTPEPALPAQSFALRWDEEAELFRPVAGKEALIQRYFRPLQ